MKTNTNQPRATASAGAPRLHSIESSGRKQFGAHLVPKASGAAVTTPASDTLNQRGGAFARHLNKAATGPQRSHHRAHQQPKWPFWDRIRHVYEGLELAPYTGRPGAMDAMALPSRVGNWLHYRDGRVAQVRTQAPGG